MHLRFLPLVLLCLFLSAPPIVAIENLAAKSAEAERVRGRLNALFYWHLADELSLSAEQERKVSQLLDKTQEIRDKAQRQRNEIMESFKANDGLSDEQLNASLKKLGLINEELARCDREELEGLLAVLGPRLTARFFVIRGETVERVKRAIQK